MKHNKSSNDSSVNVSEYVKRIEKALPSKEGEFQTRREDGELRYFFSLRDAFKDAEDKNVWKISFSIHTGERVRVVRVKDQWVFETMDMAIESLRAEMNKRTGIFARIRALFE